MARHEQFRANDLYVNRIMNLYGNVITPGANPKGGLDYYVDANIGNSGSGLGGFNDAFDTMAEAFAVLASGDRIFFRGKITESLVAPVQVFDVTIIGVGNRPRHADSTPDGGQTATATWQYGTATIANCKVLQQGWRFENILFVGPTSVQPTIWLYRDAGSGDDERDASHAEIVGCRFASGYNAISDTGGCYGVGIYGNRFVSQTNFAILGVGNIGVGQSAWHIVDNQFDANANHIKIAGFACVIKGNTFDDGGTPNTTVVCNTNNGGGANNFVVGNYFQTSTANFNSPDCVGAATDVWNNANFDTAAPGIIVGDPG